MTDGMPVAEESHQTKGLLRLTMACNERCPFCNVPVEDYAVRTPSEAQIERELDAFVDRGERTLTISGGEPTLRREPLIRWIARARERGIPFVELQTNAVLIDAAYAAALAEAGLTSAFVSLLSDVPALHDELAGLEGAFEPCVRGIDALLDSGVRVTLNPVVAHPTQERVSDYVDFVAARLPGVRSISLSVVQPHGRAAKNLDLLPDYAVLARVVPEARARAAAHGIELLNPYCGLPACIGWHDDLDHCVESVEAVAGGWRHTPGVANTGDKRQGPPCVECAVRTRCGGAWHAYWQVRGGSGLAPPIRVVEPWCELAAVAPAQTMVCAPRIDATTWPDIRAALAAAQTPAVWLWTGPVPTDDESKPVLDELLSSGCTDLALDLSPDRLDRAQLRWLRRAVGAMVYRQPQRRVRIVVGLRPDRPAQFVQTRRAVVAAAAVGVDAVRVVHPPSSVERWARFARAVRFELPGFDVAPCVSGLPFGGA